MSTNIGQHFFSLVNQWKNVNQWIDYFLKVLTGSEIMKNVGISLPLIILRKWSIVKIVSLA